MPLAYALIHREAGVSGISFPDFPGLVATGRTADEAIRKGPRRCRSTWQGWSRTATRFPTSARSTRFSAIRSFTGTPKAASWR